MSQENIHTQHHRFVSTDEKEALLSQKGIVLWMYGLSGSGKSTIAAGVERRLHQDGRFVVILDGDNFRDGLNSDLGFSDDDRSENVRRVAEVAKMFANQGVIVIVSVITPKRALRDAARSIVGDRFREIFIKASYETCAERDPKGLYAKLGRCFTEDKNSLRLKLIEVAKIVVGHKIIKLVRFVRFPTPDG